MTSILSPASPPLSKACWTAANVLSGVMVVPEHLTGSSDSARWMHSNVARVRSAGLEDEMSGEEVAVKREGERALSRQVGLRISLNVPMGGPAGVRSGVTCCSLEQHRQLPDDEQRPPPPPNCEWSLWWSLWHYDIPDKAARVSERSLTDT